jgi:hypothetical protein
VDRSVRRILVALVLVAVAVVPARAGHELPFYPSFYPQEIRVETVEPSAAGRRLATSALHAYAGADPFVGTAIPKDVTPLESLASYVVVNVDPAAVKDREARCTVVRKVLTALATVKSEFVFHPYPVTPYHTDYLSHFDRATATHRSFEERAKSEAARLDVRLTARGPLAARLVAALGGGGGERSAVIEQVDVDTLLGEARVETNGWIGPPWLKRGWYHAHLLAGATSDAETRRSTDSAYQRLVRGRYDGAAERVRLERELVRALERPCERTVAGYALRREFVSTEYSQGIENFAWDSVSGLDSAIFVRTAKLKDFPWNGWLRIGTPAPPSAAWNPFGGFTDRAGRLIWSTLGDPALIPAPHGARWLPNRVAASVAASRAAGIPVPPDSVRPSASTGALVRVSPGTRARTKLVYRVREGAFHDGSPMTVADVVYALGLPYRWSAADAPEYDSGVAKATALFRERLVAMRVVKVETVVKKYSDVEFVYQVPIIEMYVDHASVDPTELTAVAPPWTALPWHVIALLEEAARRGLGAFSRGDAARRGIPWLDVVRDPKTRDALAALVETFRAQGHVPPALRNDVTVADARARWTALKTFLEVHGHVLVTNGPYRLDTWSSDGAVLTVVRDLTYPIGVGHFDEHAIPLRAFVSKLTDLGDRIEVRADVERVSKFGREYEIVREPLGPRKPGMHEDVPDCRYVVVAADGAVVRAGRASHDEQRVFRIDVKGLRAGAYTVMVAFEANGNDVKVPVTVAEHRVPGTP